MPMPEYNLSPRTNKILYLSEQISPLDVTELTEAQIKEYNRKEFSKNRTFRNLYRPVKRKVTEDLFIIPIENGVSIYGTLFVKTKKAATDPTSLIIYIHDGGWMLGNMDKCSAICSNICAATGSAVLSIDYRMAPEFKFPIPVYDCYNAFLWAYQGARYWKLDTDKIYLLGSCAGGNLAAAVSRLARDKKGPVPAGQILIDPITDCRLRTQSIEKYKDHPIISKKILSFYINNYQREPKDILDPLFSPLLAQDHSRLPETLIIASGQNPLSEDAHLYAQALNSADSPAKIIDCPQEIHNFINYPISDRWKDTMQAISDFIRGRNVNSIDILTKEERAVKEKSHVVLIQ